MAVLRRAGAANELVGSWELGDVRPVDATDSCDVDDAVRTCPVVVVTADSHVDVAISADMRGILIDMPSSSASRAYRSSNPSSVTPLSNCNTSMLYAVSSNSSVRGEKSEEAAVVVVVVVVVVVAAALLPLVGGGSSDFLVSAAIQRGRVLVALTAR